MDTNKLCGKEMLFTVTPSNGYIQVPLVELDVSKPIFMKFNYD